MSPSNTIVSNTTLIPTAAITERSRTEQIRKYKEEMIESRAMEMWPCWHIMARAVAAVGASHAEPSLACHCHLPPAQPPDQ